MDTPLILWTPAERESFFDAIARHRRAAWRVHAVSLFASGIVALVVALLLSPLFYIALSLICDLANLIVPTVNLAGITFARISPLMDDPGAVTVTQWLELAAFAAIPGLIFMLAILFVTRRAVVLSGLLDGVQFTVVAPDALGLEEQRFRNVVGEMAVAAGLEEPRVLIADWPSQNGAVSGANDGSAVVVVSRQLIQAADRAQLQAIAAHLVGSIANGDMAIGMRVATTLGLFGLIARLGGAFTRRASMARLMRVLARVAFRPTALSARAYVDEIAQPFRQEEDAETDGASTSQKDWRAIAALGADAAPSVISLPLAKLAIIVPLCLLVGVLLAAVLALLMWLSVALSMMFLGLPFGALHLLLRWIGH